MHKLIENLKIAGFKEYEAKIFYVLMKGNPMSVSEIAKEAKLIRNSIYDTLKSFAERGYCNEIETNTILKYQIIEPVIILGKIEKELNDDVKNKLKILKETFDEISKIQFDNNNHKISTNDNVELIRGFNKHRVSKYVELINKAKYEILSMNRIKGLITEEINEFTTSFIQKGGSIRSIYRISLDFKIKTNERVTAATNEDLIHVCEMFERFGEEVKLTSIEIPNMIIIDRERVYMNIEGKKEGGIKKQSDLIIHDINYAKNMCDFFNTYWDKSVSLNEFKNIQLKNINQFNKS